MDEHCPLCESLGGELVWQDAHCRVVQVEGPEQQAFPGFCRVIWSQHCTEMSELLPRDSGHLLQVVLAVERVLRRLVNPDKINLASLGNVVPHLHWHIIPRWTDDTHFPAPIWGASRDDVCSTDGVAQPSGCAGTAQCAVNSPLRLAPTRKPVSCATLSVLLADELKDLDKVITP